MIDINDPRNQHLLAHPHFLAGVEHERERLLSDPELYRQLRQFWLASQLMKKDDSE